MVEQDFLEDEKGRELILRRTHVIDDILTSGVKSSRMLKSEGRFYLGSADGQPLDFIEGSVLQPLSSFQDKEAFLRDLHDALYLDVVGVLSVVVERDDQVFQYGTFYDYDKAGEENLYKRAKSSLLIVARREIGSEMRFKENIPPEEFLHILLPKNVMDEWSRNTKLETSVFPLRIIHDEVDAEIFPVFAGLKYLRVPNYERVIVEILEGLNQPIWVHGVRLPIEEDLVQKEK